MNTGRKRRAAQLLQPQRGTVPTLRAHGHIYFAASMPVLGMYRHTVSFLFLCDTDRAAKEHLPAVASSPSPSDSGTTVLEPLRVWRRLGNSIFTYSLPYGVAFCSVSDARFKKSMNH
jgi:hypothetical protein